jgi:hypothetical protein
MGKTLPDKLLNTSSPGMAEKRNKISRQSLLTICQDVKAKYTKTSHVLKRMRFYTQKTDITKLQKYPLSFVVSRLWF